MDASAISGNARCRGENSRAQIRPVSKIAGKISLDVAGYFSSPVAIRFLTHPPLLVDGAVVYRLSASFFSVFVDLAFLLALRVPELEFNGGRCCRRPRWRLRRRSPHAVATMLPVKCTMHIFSKEPCTCGHLGRLRGKCTTAGACGRRSARQGGRECP